MKTILVVGSEPGVAVVLQAAVESADCTVSTSKTGKNAIKLAKRGKTDLILLASPVEDMNVAALCRALRSDPRTVYIPVIVMSAQSDMNKEAASRYGVAAHITKPFDVWDLRQQVLAKLSQRVDTRSSQDQQKEISQDPIEVNSAG